jgi:transposase-like protein
MPEAYPAATREKALTMLKARPNVSLVSRQTGVPRCTLIRWYKKAGLSRMKTVTCPHCKREHRVKRYE